MKQYQFSLKDECIKEYIGYLPNFFDVTKEEIPVPKIYLSSFTDGKIYNENELEIRSVLIEEYLEILLSKLTQEQQEEIGYVLDSDTQKNASWRNEYYKINRPDVEKGLYIREDKRYNIFNDAGEYIGYIENYDKFILSEMKVAIPKQKVDDTELHLLNLGFEIKFIKNELLPLNTAMVSKDIYEILKNKYQNNNQ